MTRWIVSISGSRRLAGSLAALGIALSLLTVVVKADPPTTAEASVSPDVPPIDFKPISYFNDRCGSCHGNYGSFWGEGFVRDLKDAELRTVVKEMAEGPAQAPLEDQPLAALVAYHRSLTDGSPYLILTRREGSQLAGEVTPGATVVIQSGDQTIPARVDQHSWAVTLDATDGDWTLIASKDGKITHLRAAEWHSHRR